MVIPNSAAFSANSDLRRKRKISKVKTKSKSQKDDLAESVIKGNLRNIEDIIDVLDSLYGAGFPICLSYKYQYNHSTDTVRVQEKETADEFVEESVFSTDLNIVHLACIFDQDQVLEFLSLYGVASMRESVSSKPPALVSAWFGALSTLHTLHRLGFNLLAQDGRQVRSEAGHENVTVPFIAENRPPPGC